MNLVFIARPRSKCLKYLLIQIRCIFQAMWLDNYSKKLENDKCTTSKDFYAQLKLNYYEQQ